MYQINESISHSPSTGFLKSKYQITILSQIEEKLHFYCRMTKCTFHKFGSSGEIEKHDAMCILPLNMVNEKIYIFLWFWLLILGFLTFLVVGYRLLIILSPRIRVSNLNQSKLCIHFQFLFFHPMNGIIARSNRLQFLLLKMFFYL